MIKCVTGFNWRFVGQTQRFFDVVCSPPPFTRPHSCPPLPRQWITQELSSSKSALHDTSEAWVVNLKNLLDILHPHLTVTLKVSRLRSRVWWQWTLLVDMMRGWLACCVERVERATMLWDKVGMRVCCWFYNARSF